MLAYCYLRVPNESKDWSTLSHLIEINTEISHANVWLWTSEDQSAVVLQIVILISIACAQLSQYSAFGTTAANHLSNKLIRSRMQV